MSITHRSPSDAHADDDLQHFLTRLRPAGREAFLGVRALARSLGSDVEEHARRDRVSYSRRGHDFVQLENRREKLDVIIPEDVEVKDPGGRLLRRGNVRHAPIDDARSLDAHVEGFIRQAYARRRGG